MVGCCRWCRVSSCNSSRCWWRDSLRPVRLAWREVGCFLAGGLLALATIKPQLAWPIVLWLPLWARSDWRSRRRLVCGLGWSCCCCWVERNSSCPDGCGCSLPRSASITGTPRMSRCWSDCLVDRRDGLSKFSACWRAALRLGHAAGAGRAASFGHSCLADPCSRAGPYRRRHSDVRALQSSAAGPGDCGVVRVMRSSGRADSVRRSLCRGGRRSAGLALDHVCGAGAIAYYCCPGRRQKLWLCRLLNFATGITLGLRAGVWDELVGRLRDRCTCRVVWCSKVFGVAWLNGL